MPTKPKKPCRHPGCRKLTENKYCEEHIRLHANERGSSARQGYDSRWKKARLLFLKAHPFCEACKAEGKITQATVVDHIVPHRGDELLFWDESNWQALCKRCHDRKTRTKDQYKEYKY